MKNPPYHSNFHGISTPMRFLILLTVFPCLLACSHAVAAAELHVNPRGDDNNPVTSAKPMRTLDGARAAVRKLADNWIGTIKNVHPSSKIDRHGFAALDRA